MSGPSSLRVAVAWLRVQGWSAWQSTSAGAISTVAFLSAISAALAFFRDALFGATFGTTPHSDAYFVGQLVFNTVVLVLAWGSLSVAVPPLLVDDPCKVSASSRAQVVGGVLIIAAGALGVIALVAMMAATGIVGVLAPGLRPAERAEAADLLWILGPAMLLSGVAAVAARVVQLEDDFTWPGIANLVSMVPVLLVLIAGIFGPQNASVRMVAAAFTAGAALQAALLGVRLRRHAAWPHAAVVRGVTSRIVPTIGPVLLYNGLAQSAVLWERTLASTLAPGTVAEFNYAVRLFGLLGLFCITPISTVFYPRYSNLRSSLDRMASSEYLKRTMEFTFLISGLAATIFISAGYELVAAVYGRGNFDSSAVQNTYMILAFYAIGALPTGATAIMNTATYSVGIGWIPMLAEMMNLPVYALLAWFLTSSSGSIGLAFARGLSFWITFALVIAFSRRKTDLLVRPLLVSCGVCVVAVFLSSIARMLAFPPHILRNSSPVVDLALVVALSSGVYLLVIGTAWWCGILQHERQALSEKS